MPILTEDIKLLKSAVMADVPEGGGAMTGIAVVDGQSNNLFPDTSAMDRAFGRVNARKVFGVAHTDDTDTLMGAHAIITQAPADPLVHCTLLRTPNWADTRVVAKDGIEKYLVKGPRNVYRLWDAHYAGSLQIRLVSMVGGTPPASGDAVVLLNPNGQEQYVRILRVTTVTQTIAVIEGNGTVLVNASVATCDIGNPLAYDFFGPPATRVGLNEALFAQLFGTNIAGGAKFYGIKQLGTDAIPGDYSVLTNGGIYTPVVPAATIESPLIDLYPLTMRQSISRTAVAAVTLPSVSMTFGPGAVLYTPTAMEPGSVRVSHASTLFTDDGAGLLKQGSTTVGTVAYSAKTITLSPGSPSYGYSSVSVVYKPASVAGAAVHSVAVPITVANQGLVFTQAFEPPPAPGSFTVSYMAQARWYDLMDNANGKLSGVDSGYGIGTVNYITGSVGLTLGAIPDVGSSLIFQWGDASAAVQSEAVAPNRLTTRIITAPEMDRATVGLLWSRGATTYTAQADAAGVLTGDATGFAINGAVTFSPSVFPDGEVTVEWDDTPVASTGNTVTNGSGSYSLVTLPIAPGSIYFSVLTLGIEGFEVPSFVVVRDDGAGLLVATVPSGTPYSAGDTVAVGAINYTTGALTLNASVSMGLSEYRQGSYPMAGGAVGFYTYKYWLPAQSVNLQNANVAYIGYRTAGTVTPSSLVVTPALWSLPLTIPTGLNLRTTGATFSVGNDTYYADAGALSSGWNVNTGMAVEPAAGAVADTGAITVSVLPSNGQNLVTLFNAALDKSNGLTVGQGVFRIASAPVKVGVFQIQAGSLVGSANDSGIISGSGWSGTVDYQRGIVQWSRTGNYAPANYGGWLEQNPIAANALSYNAVFLQYLPLDATLLGLDTVRLPLDGKVPIYRTGDLLVVHNTLTTQLPNPLVKGTVYPLGRERIASVRIKDVLGVVVPSSLYVSDLNPGTITVPAESDITAYAQPWTVEHRIEDMMVCSQADISGQLKFTRSLTHDFPASNSFVSSALPFGDLFARPYGYIEQGTWTGIWSDALVGAAPALANFNEGQYPVTVTNRGAITERWALIFTSNTAFRIVGESVGDIGTGNTGSAASPINPATGAAYFTLPALGWGNGWSIGNVLRFNTAACGAPFWPIRTVLQGPATLDSDVFSIAFRGDVDHP